jgi:hypothetical protein
MWQQRQPLSAYGIQPCGNASAHVGMRCSSTCEQVQSTQRSQSTPDLHLTGGMQTQTLHYIDTTLHQKRPARRSLSKVEGVPEPSTFLIHP